MLNTFEDVQQLARYNPIVHTWLYHYLRGDVSREQMLIGCVLSLAEVNTSLMEDLKDALSRLPPKIILDTRTAVIDHYDEAGIPRDKDGNVVGFIRPPASRP